MSATLFAGLEALHGPIPEVQEGFTGVIVALPVPPTVARRVAVKGGEAVEGLHVTLAYLGNLKEFAGSSGGFLVGLSEGLRQLAVRTRPLRAHFGGPGTFRAEAGKDPAYLSVDAPDLPEFRQEVTRLIEANGLEYSKLHGFTPHVTLAYQDRGDEHPCPNPDTTAFQFTQLGLWVGGRHLNFPLLGGEVIAKAAAPGDPRDAARDLLAQLGADLLTLDRQDRALTARGEVIRQHHAQAFAGLSGAVSAPRGSAVEDAALWHASQAAGARRVNDWQPGGEHAPR